MVNKDIKKIKIKKKHVKMAAQVGIWLEVTTVIVNKDILATTVKQVTIPLNVLRKLTERLNIPMRKQQ